HCWPRAPQPRRLICHRVSARDPLPRITRALANALCPWSGMKGPSRPGHSSRARLRLVEPAGRVRLQVLSESATTTNQAPKLARLIVRESPVLASLTVLDHNPSFVAGGNLKRAGNEFYSHCAPSMFAKTFEQHPVMRFLRGRHSSSFAWVPQGSHQ